MSLELRLTRVLVEHIKTSGTAHALAKKINATSLSAACKGFIDHRTIEKIVEEPEQVMLSYRNLAALHNYLCQYGEALDEQPIFDKKGVLQCLVEAGQVSFLLGVNPRPVERRNDLSQWDTKSVATLLHEICRLKPGAEIEIEDVLLNPAVNSQNFTDQPWHEILQNEDRSLISIGAPRACLASEVLLAKMFGFTPFVRPTGSVVKSPFYFIWPPDEGKDFRSRFALTGEDLKADHPKAARAVLKDRASAFQLGSEVFVIPRQGKCWTMYGVIAAQRRSNGQVWLVVAGISGPATYATASLVRKITAVLPSVKHQDSPVLWMPVKAVIESQNSTKEGGDIRVVKSCEPFRDPDVWEPASKTVGPGAAPAKSRGRG